MNATELAAAASRAFAVDLTAHWGPTIDGVETTDSPYNLTKQGQMFTGPLMIGTARDETCSLVSGAGSAAAVSVFLRRLHVAFSLSLSLSFLPFPSFSLSLSLCVCELHAVPRPLRRLRNFRREETGRLD